MTAITFADVLQTIAIIIVLVGALHRMISKIEKELHDQHESLRKDIEIIFRKLPIEYVRIDDFKAYKKETAEELRRIKAQPIICRGAHRHAP